MRTKLSFLSLLLAFSPLAAVEPVREMSTDRPDTTESPYSVPAGMFQIKASFFEMGVSYDSVLQIVVNSHALAGQDADYQTLFDAGVRLGMNRAASDLGVFTGMSIRF